VEKNALITGSFLTIEDHGFLTAWVGLDYGGVCQSFGGYSLYLPKSFKHHLGQKNFAGLFIHRCLEIADVTEWSKIKGKTIRVRADNGKVHAIGHIIKDEWFNPTEEFARL